MSKVHRKLNQKTIDLKNESAKRSNEILKDAMDKGTITRIPMPEERRAEIIRGVTRRNEDNA